MKHAISKENIFLDLGFAEAEAKNLNIRSTLMIAIEKEIKKQNLTQLQAAKLLGVSQPRISDLLRGEIHKFTIDALIIMLGKFNMQVSVIVKRKKAA